jgi:hypothetical protein
MLFAKLDIFAKALFEINVTRIVKNVVYFFLLGAENATAIGTITNGQALTSTTAATTLITAATTSTSTTTTSSTTCCLTTTTTATTMSTQKEYQSSKQINLSLLLPYTYFQNAIY